MNTPSPVDPEKLRARLSQAVEPIKPSPDALVQIKAGVRRRQRWAWGIGSGAGLLVAGAAAAVIAVGSLGHPSAAPRTVAPGYSPTVSTTPTTSPTSHPAVAAPASPRPSVTRGLLPSLPVAAAQPATAGVVTTQVRATTKAVATITGKGTSATPPAGSAVTPTSTGTLQPGQHDLDHDGKADVVRTEFLDSKTARLVMTTAGRTLHSAPFPLFQGLGAGSITYIQISGSAGRSEVLVKDPGADHISYRLYQYAGGLLQAVPTPSDAPQWIVTGGGSAAPMSFGCPGGALTVNVARPTSMQKYLAGTDKTYVFESYGYVFSYGSTTLKHFTGFGSAFMLTRGQALARLAAAPHDSCGAS